MGHWEAKIPEKQTTQTGQPFQFCHFLGWADSGPTSKLSFSWEDSDAVFERNDSDRPKGVGYNCNPFWTENLYKPRVY